MCGLNVLVLMIATSDMYQPQKKPARGRHEGGGGAPEAWKQAENCNGNTAAKKRKEKNRKEKKKRICFGF